MKMDREEFEKMVQREWDNLPAADRFSTWPKMYNGIGYDFAGFRRVRFGEELNNDETPRV